MFIVRDAIHQAERAYPSLREARAAALDVRQGDIVRVKLKTSLKSLQLYCALYNHDGFASEQTVVAVIENGMARKIVEPRLIEQAEG